MQTKIPFSFDFPDMCIKGDAEVNAHNPFIRGKEARNTAAHYCVLKTT